MLTKLICKIFGHKWNDPIPVPNYESAKEWIYVCQRCLKEHRNKV